MMLSEVTLLVGQSISMLVVAIYSLLLGVQVLRRKPVSLPPGAARAVFLLTVAPPMIATAVPIVQEVLDPEVGTVLGAMFVIPFIMLGFSLVLLMSRAIPGGMWMMNVTENMVLDALMLASREFQLSPTFQQIGGDIIRLGKKRIRVEFVDSSASATLSISVLGQARLKFEHKGELAVHSALLDSFAAALKTYQCGKSLFLGIILTTVGLFGSGVLLYIWIKPLLV